MNEDPLARFEAEHDEALTALARLEAAAAALRAHQPPGPHLAAIRELHALLTGPVRRHNENEETALFPALGGQAPLDPFLDDHQTLWRWEDELAAALRRTDAETVARLSLDIVVTLRDHIRRENEMLFPMARALLGREGLARVAQRLEETR